jgi:penicillin amidase
MHDPLPSLKTAPARSRPGLRRVLRGAAIAAATALVLALAAVLLAYAAVRRSLAQTEGVRPLPGLHAPAVVERDALGVPTITGQSLEDVTRALGFVHAQERFFQMDLSRRRAAGELAELLGAAALPVDRAARLHRFRARTRANVAGLSGGDRRLLEAYAAGVNAGLAALGAAPPEYLVLRTSPAPWQPEDSLLVVATMFFNLQDARGTLERRTLLVHETFPPALAEFLTTTRSEWETPLVGEPGPAPVPPGPRVFDLRTAAAVPPPAGTSRSAVPASPLAEADRVAVSLGLAPPDEEARGSNNWVVAGSATASGRPLLANDMHLGIAVPNTWFRASLVWEGARGRRRATGVTLPGVPGVIAGSNGDVAWGFTNTTADWTDLVAVEIDPADPTRYRVPGGWRPLERHAERIGVKGGADELVEVVETIWGPVLPPDDRGRVFAVRWVAHEPEALGVSLGGILEARRLAEVFAVARHAGIPAQNLVAADREGHIGWTVAGRIPRRVGFDGRLPASWADGSRRWDGWYAPEAYPEVVDPPDGRIVTANNRLVDGRWLAMLGDGGYDPGARARQIREGLDARERLTPADMLAIQLDDRAVLMERWRRVVLEVLTPERAASSPERAEFLRLVLTSWDGRASTPSVGYRLVRSFRLAFGELAMAPFVARLRERDPEFPAAPGRASEGVMWALLSRRPPHLLDPRFASWDDLILAAVDETVRGLTAGGGRLADRTWGEANTTRIEHPLSRALPWAGRWLDMPRQPLPGDSHMPRVQAPGAGASERLAVSPGHEADGYFHMPGGQSGHPLSPHYRDGHDAWVRGVATPFLPGPAQSTLRLVP